MKSFFIVLLRNVYNLRYNIVVSCNYINGLITTGIHSIKLMITKPWKAGFRSQLKKKLKFIEIFTLKVRKRVYWSNKSINSKFFFLACLIQNSFASTKDRKIIVYLYQKFKIIHRIPEFIKSLRLRNLNFKTVEFCTK